MKTVILNELAKTYYLCSAKLYGCATYPLHYEQAETKLPRLRSSKQLITNDIYNSYASNIIDLAKSQVDNGALNIAHQWVVENFEPYKIMTVTRNNAFYSDLERWRASGEIYFPNQRGALKIYDCTKYLER